MTPRAADAEREETAVQADFHRFAETNADVVAVVDPKGREWARGELAALVNGLVRAWRAAGLSDGDAVAILAPNCAEYLAAYLAGLDAGLSVVPVNRHLAEDELAYVLEDTGTRAVVVHEDLSPRLLAAVTGNPRIDTRVSIGDVPGCVRLHDFVAPYSAERPGTTATGRMMAYTSATTGKPKAVKLPEHNAAAALDRIVRSNAALGILPEDGNVHLCASMLYHSAPLGGAEIALRMGHRVILADRWEPELLLRLIDEHRVTTTFMVPTMFVRLLKLPDATRQRYSTASLHFVTHGAAPCPRDVKRRMIEWWGEIIWESYGATEVQGTIASAAEWLRFPGTVGRPLPGSEVRVLDERRRERRPFEVGLVYVRPHTGDRFEYRGHPEATRRAWHGELVTVGDLGYVNEDGYLFLCDRSADLIISAGVNIYPAEIESVLVEHPRVRDCAVTGEAHELLGQVPKAFVELEAGCVPGPALTADLLRFAGARLAAAKLPKRVEYVAALPRDPNGKLYRRRLHAARGDDA